MTGCRTACESGEACYFKTAFICESHSIWKLKKKKKTTRKNQQQIRDILSSELSKLTYFLRPFRKQVLNACNEIFMHLQRNEEKFEQELSECHASQLRDSSCWGVHPTGMLLVSGGTHVLNQNFFRRHLFTRG